MTKKILFIINPVSGVGKQKIIEKLIESSLDKKMYEYKIKYTEEAKHAINISKQAAEKYDIVVAVGGDGSVNEVSKGLIGTNTSLAIIPTGSGNGLARHLKIPLNPKKAIELLNHYHTRKMDTVQINDELFVNIAGFGFDAHISHLFADFGKRGFLSYLKLILKEFRKYQSKTYQLSVNDTTFHKSAFILSIANSTQYGNEGYIAPKASIDDGLVDICIVRKFPIRLAPILALKLIRKRIDDSKYLESFKGEKIIIESDSSMTAHIDGEPVHFPKRVEISVKPLSLNLIVP